MAKDLKEQIQIMTHYLNGGDVEFYSDFNKRWEESSTPVWDQRSTDYRIKEQKKTVIIEKWLMKAGDKKSFFITDGDKSFFENYYTSNEKIKLLETYEVEL